MALTDTLSHPPPTTGNFPYSCNNPALGGTWYPGSPNPPSPFPALGETYVDPVFGQRVRRLTNILTNSNLIGDSVNYDWHGLWNADATLRAIDDGLNAGTLSVINATTGAIVRASIPHTEGIDPGLQFDPNFPDVWYYPSGTQLRKFSIASGTSSLVKDFGVNLMGLGGTSDKVDLSGRYWVLALNTGGTFGQCWAWDGIDANGRLPGDPAYVPQAAGLTNMFTGQFTISGTTQAFSNGYASMAPDASGVFVADDAAGGPGGGSLDWHPMNVGAHTMGAAIQRGQLLGGDHGDVTLDPNGKVWWVTVEAITGEWTVEAYNLTDGGHHTLLQVGNNNSDEDLSGISRGQWRGWCVITLSYSPVDDFASWQHFHAELFMVSVTSTLANPVVRRLCHHRSRGFAGDADGYIRDARVSVDNDGTKAAFTSSYGRQSTQGTPTAHSYADIWAVDIGCANPPILVQSKSAQTASSVAQFSVTFDAPVTSGNLVVGMLDRAYDAGLTFIVSIVDDKGNSYMPVVDTIIDATNGEVLNTFFLANITNGPRTITVTLGDPHFVWGLIVHEISGVNHLAAHTGQFQSQPGILTDAVTSGPVTTTIGCGYVVGFCGQAAGSSVVNTAGTGFTMRQIINDTPPNSPGVYSEDQVQQSAGSIAATFTENANRFPRTAILVFDNTGAPPPPPSPTPPMGRCLRSFIYG